MQKILKQIFVLLISISAIFGVKYFIATDFFYIKDLEIKGEISNIGLKQQLDANLSKLKGQNIVRLDEAKIQEFLKKDVRIKDVAIKKRYPSKIEVVVEERTPYVYIKEGNEFYVADRELNVFGYFDEFSNGDMPIVTINKQNKKQSEKNDIKDILANIQSKHLYSVISQIRRNNEVYELILLNGVKIITNAGVKADKYDKVIKLYEKIKTKQPVNYMDVRFKDINVK